MPLVAGDDGAGGRHARPDDQRARLSDLGTVVSRRPAPAVAIGRRMTRRAADHVRGRRGRRQVDPDRAPGRDACAPRASTSSSPASRAARPGAEAIRELLVEGAPERWLPLTETLLLLAARDDHVARRDRAGAGGRALGAVRPLHRFDPGLPGHRRRRRRWSWSIGLHATVFGDLRPDLTAGPRPAGRDRASARRRQAAAGSRFERDGQRLPRAGARQASSRSRAPSPSAASWSTRRAPADAVAADVRAVGGARFGARSRRRG